jgi:ABC-2 type transport system permease protein
VTVRAFPFLLTPHVLSTRNRAAARQRGDTRRALLFAVIGAGVVGLLYRAAFWLTMQLAEYAELGDYLLRMGLSWLFLTFLSFLAFSAVVTSLSTFFLSDDLRLLLVAPVATRRVFHARFARTLVQASWMVAAFLAPVLVGIGRARCAGAGFYVTAASTTVAFVIIPVACGAAVTLVLVNTFPARRARDILMLMGVVFAGSLVVVLRFIRPEQLLRVESLPDLTDFFATLQSPVTPLLPSFWAGEALFASLHGSLDLLHAAALWTTALGSVVLVSAAYERWYFAGYSRSQEAPKARFAKFHAIDALARALPMSPVRQQLLTKDLKIFLRDVSQWSQLLLLVALVMLYLYNFRVLDLQRVPYMSGFLKNVYAFVNLGMAGLVLATVAVRFVFPSVSAEGAAFWIVRTAPVRLRDFLWAKFWAGVVPLLVMTEILTVTANHFLGVDPFLKAMAAFAILCMTFALVGLATGLGARFPRFGADVSQIAGSYGGVAFMTQAVLFVIVTIALLGWPSSIYLVRQARGLPPTPAQAIAMGGCFAAAIALSLTVWLASMRSGVEALERMSD